MSIFLYKMIVSLFGVAFAEPNGPRHEKACLLGFRPGHPKNLLSYRD